MKDYETEEERSAYSKGVFAHINGHPITDNPHGAVVRKTLKLFTAWNNGHCEKGSIAERVK